MALVLCQTLVYLNRLPAVHLASNHCALASLCLNHAFGARLDVLQRAYVNSTVMSILRMLAISPQTDAHGLVTRLQKQYAHTNMHKSQMSKHIHS